MDIKKLYGMVSALGTTLGNRAKEKPEILTEFRAIPDAASGRAWLTAAFAGDKLESLCATFLEAIPDEEWLQWRSRILLQAKMVRDGAKPAPGHEKR